jgi:hypothetical protein
VDVFEGNYVPADTIYKAFNGIQCHKVANVLGFEIFRFPNDFLTIDLPNFAEVGEFLGGDSETTQVFDETADGFLFGAT